LLGREQNTVEINTDGGERDPLAADFLVRETQSADVSGTPAPGA
jgi:hypothetical protein